MISADEVGARSGTPATVELCQASTSFALDTLASGLAVPWDIAFLDDGSAFVTERGGRVLRVGSDGVAEPLPFLEVEAHAPSGSEIGLMGIDVSPDGEFLYYSITEAAGSGLLARLGRRAARLLAPERGHAITLGVYRIPIAADGGPEEVVTGIPAGFIHGGGALRFGPDDLLYLTNGDGGDHWRAQQAQSPRGKLLRFTPDGDVPRSNPDPRSPVFATGIRHSQGLAWAPTGRLLAIDHGPTGLDSEANRTDHDELDVVAAGDNLGWPIVAGASEGGGLRSPVVEWTPALAPAGLAWFADPGSPWDSSVFVTGLRGTRLVRLQIADDAEGVRVVCTENLLQSTHGRLRLVRQAPDGSIWVGTSNRDGRGLPRDSDDLILRLRPVGPA